MIGVAMVGKSTHGEPAWMTIQEWFWLQETIKEGDKKRAERQDKKPERE